MAFYKIFDRFEMISIKFLCDKFVLFITKSFKIATKLIHLGKS